MQRRKSWVNSCGLYRHGTFTLDPSVLGQYGSGAPALAAQSFDSRYWGPITRQDIRRVTRS
ncbi:hypothetical protein THICB3590008 [Thiomonas sp. CB3]|nr:hypothetical protein THICB3590008 [Thiomonas sp. CB3]